MNSGKLLLGVLAGVATGAVLGILFAPDKGSNTRKKIQHKGEDYADALKEKFDGLLDAIADKFEDTKAQAEEWATKGKTKFDELKQEAKETVA